MTAPTYTHSSTKSRRQEIATGDATTSISTTVHDGAVCMSITQGNLTNPPLGTYYVREPLRIESMSAARELATAINQSADWVDSGKPIPIAKPAPTASDNGYWTELRIAVMLILWTIAAVAFGVWLAGVA